jgi:small GTP-binding protein
MDADPSFFIRAVLIGEMSVGKTSILRRFLDDSFKDGYVSTIGIDFGTRTALVGPNGSAVKFQIVDTSGQERFHALSTSYYRGVHAIVMVYDVSNRKSFEQLTYWRNHVDERRIDSIHRFYVVGNKCDTERAVSYEEGLAFAQAKTNTCFCELSAKTGKHVTDLFSEIAQDLVPRLQAVPLPDVITTDREDDLDAFTIIQPAPHTGCWC